MSNHEALPETLENSHAVTAQNKKDARLIGPMAQVNLLPEEFKQRRKRRSTSMWLLVAVAATVLVAAVAFLLSWWVESEAKRHLEAAEAQTEPLLTELNEYAELPLTESQLNAAKEARDTATKNEVMWQPLIQDLINTAPQPVTILDLDLDGQPVSTATASPSAAASSPAPSASPSENASPSPSATPSPSPSSSEGQNRTISVTYATTAVPNISDWMDAIERIKGLSVVSLTSTELSDNDGKLYYQVNLTAHVTDQALANRFGKAATQ